MKCEKCGFILYRVDSGWKSETIRPYGIYACMSCKNVIAMYDDEIDEK